MKKENQTIADFIVEFDPNTKVDIYEKVKEYKSTHGKDAYLFELPKTQEEDPKHYGNCPEEDKLELLYLNPNQLEVYSNAQRQRLDVTDDKVVRKMEEGLEKIYSTGSSRIYG